MLKNEIFCEFKYEYNENSENSCSEIEEKSKIFTCHICGASVYSKASLLSHVSCHDSEYSKSSISYDLGVVKSETDAPNTCNICFKKFTAKRNLLKHLRNVHKNYSEADRMVVKKIKCPERSCKFLCRMMKELRDHIETCHKIKILKDTLQFPSESVFQKWKKEEERNTVSWFVIGRKKTTLMNGTKKQTLYCHRTGHYNPKGFGKYRMRSVGSCKIGVTCPAAMEVTESLDGEITVIYYKTHLGHMQDVVYLKLTQEERAQLAEKIKQGFSFDAILEDIKESMNFDEEKKKRIHLLSKKYLYNIMRAVKCTKKKTIKKIRNHEKDRKGNSKNKRRLVFDENAVKIENMEVEGLEGNISQFIALHPSPYMISMHKKDKSFEENPNSVLHQKNQRDVNIPQTSSEEVASQIIILSPDIDYNSVAEIILLSADKTSAQPAVLSQTKFPVAGNCTIQSSDLPTKTINDVIVEEKNQINKPNLHLRLKEKLHKISELLPQSKHLTPKQYDLINTKLDGVLDMFKMANAKARARKQSSHKKVKKGRVLRSSGKIED